jgi:hypothetical protein
VAHRRLSGLGRELGTGHQETSYKEEGNQKTNYKEEGNQETNYKEEGNQETNYKEEGNQETNYKEEGNQKTNYKEEGNQKTSPAGTIVTDLWRSEQGQAKLGEDSDRPKKDGAPLCRKLSPAPAPSAPQSPDRKL